MDSPTPVNGQQSADALLWLRMPEEPILWFGRFSRFLSLGPTRSMLAVYKEEREREGTGGKPETIPGSWEDASRLWRWRERADAHDMEQIARAKAAREREASKSQKDFAAIAAGLRGITAAGIPALKGEKLTALSLIKLGDAAIRWEMYSRGVAASYPGRPEDAEDLQAALAFYRAVVESNGVSDRDRLYAQSRIDKLLGLEQTTDGDDEDSSDDPLALEAFDKLSPEEKLRHMRQGSGPLA